MIPASDHRLASDGRAVSDVVGYVLIFSLIVVTVGVVTTTGFAALDDRQAAERINNVERAFDVFANNVDDVYRDGAPSRATEMRLSGGELRYGDQVNITIRNPDNHNINHTISITPLIYSSAGTEIVYEGGTVIRDNGVGSVMLNEPPFYFDSERSILSLVRTTRSSGMASISHSGTVQIESAHRSTNISTQSGLRNDGNVVQIVIESPRADAWQRYLNSTDGEIIDTDNQSVVFEFETKTLEAPRFRIQLDYIL